NGAVSLPESQSERLARVAALGEPLRRAVYLYVASQQESVSRDQTADRFGLSRAVAAFHLDKLADLGLLEVEFKRPPGRTGPGAGRPAKRYRVGEREISVSLPPREYELAGRLLAEAVTTSTRDGVPVDEALSNAARRVGRSLGRRALEAAGERPSEDGLAQATRAVLNACAYEPREEGNELVLTNCPFHALAADYRELVCGMNLALMSGLTEEVGSAGLDARLDPHPGECCVRLTRRSP
ncbi:MAG TPA: helix-turn-helix domain-containing protein, partial [Acidimicrobiales bacterium]|nr:helix-turn-helix domain-containing protein [Acidimicrobiales bacterium]